jgi:hypothetical protein
VLDFLTPKNCFVVSLALRLQGMWYDYYSWCYYQFLYFAGGSMMDGFSVYTMMPRTLVSVSCSVGSITSSSTVLIIEIDNSWEPLDFLKDIEVY